MHAPLVDHRREPLRESRLYSNRQSSTRMMSVQIAALLLATLLVHYERPLVASDSVRDSQAELNWKITNLEAIFKDAIQEQFYKRRESSGGFHQTNEVKRYPFLQLFAEIGKIELAQYKRERKALWVAKVLIERYLTGPSAGLNGRLPTTKSMADYIIIRSIMRAYQGDCEEQQDSRRRICLWAESFHMTEYMKARARNYYLRLRDRRAVARKASAVKDNALEAFKTEAAGHMSEEKMAEAVELVDVLIVEAEGEYEATQQLPEIVGRVSHDIVQTDLEASRRAELCRFKLYKLDRAMPILTMDHVETFEESLLRTVPDPDMRFPPQRDPTPADLIREIDDQLDLELPARFIAFMRANFDERPHRLLEQHGTYHSLALSVLLAESYGLFHAAEKKVLEIMQATIWQLFIERSRQLNESLVKNSNLYQLILRRALQHAIWTGLLRTLNLRRQIYLMLSRYRHRDYVSRLAVSFYNEVGRRKEQFAELRATCARLLRQYENDVSLVLSEEQVQNTSTVVDQLINDAIERDGLVMLQNTNNSLVTEIDLRHALRRAIGDEWFDKIVERDEEMKSRGYGFGQSEIDSVGIEDLLAFEDSQVPPTRPGPSRGWYRRPGED